MINPPTSFVPELCLELFKAIDGKDYGRAVEAQKKVDTAARLVETRLRKYGRVPLQEVSRMRGFAVKRFPKWETEQMPKEEVVKLERELREAGILRTVRLPEPHHEENRRYRRQRQIGAAGHSKPRGPRL
jgi:hypothetical protein